MFATLSKRTLIESFDAVFNVYDPNSKTFTLEGNTTYTWSPNN